MVLQRGVSKRSLAGTELRLRKMSPLTPVPVPPPARPDLNLLYFGLYQRLSVLRQNIHHPSILHLSPLTFGPLTNHGRPRADHRYHYGDQVRIPMTPSMETGNNVPCHRRHVLNDTFRLGPAATGDLTLLLTAITTTSKFIATNVRRARLINL